jgi:hypothetical protein
MPPQLNSCKTLLLELQTYNDNLSLGIRKVVRHNRTTFFFETERKVCIGL